MKHWKTMIAVLLCVLLLTVAAAADNTVTTDTDEDGNPVTIVTDENGNQTVITEVEPGADDITFDEGELDLDAEEGEGDGAQTTPAESAAPAAQSEKGVSPLAWLVPLLVAVCACAVVLTVRLLKKKNA